MRHFVRVGIPVVHTAFVRTEFLLFLLWNMSENSTAAQAYVDGLFPLKIGLDSISGNVELF